MQESMHQMKPSQSTKERVLFISGVRKSAGVTEAIENEEIVQSDGKN